jgi:hypothetical protein
MEGRSSILAMTLRAGTKAFDIPIEIWDSVAENFFERSSELKNLSLTCRRFQAIFQPIVFSRIRLVIREEKTISQQKQLLDLATIFANKPAFKRRLKQVTLEGPPGVHEAGIFWIQPGPATLELLGILPVFETLILSEICIVQDLMTQIRHPRSLKHLELNYVVFGSEKTSEALKSLDLSSLISLTLRQHPRTHGHSRAWDEDAVASLAFSPSLTKLHIQDDCKVPRAMNRLLDGVHHEPFMNLTTLEILEPAFDDDLYLFRIGLQCPNVVTLKCFRNTAVIIGHKESAPADVVQRAFPRLSDFSGSVSLATRLLPGRPLKAAYLRSRSTVRLSEAFLTSIFPQCNSLRKLEVQYVLWEDDMLAVVE